MPDDLEGVRVIYRRALPSFLRRLKRKKSSERKIAKQLKISYSTIQNIRKNPDRKVSLKTMKIIIRLFNPAPPKKKKRVVPFSANRGWHYGDCL